MQKLIDYPVKKDLKIQTAKDMFLFAIYAGGLRFGDVLELQFKHYSFEENKKKQLIKQLTELNKSINLK